VVGVKSYHIDHQSFFRLFATSPPPRYIIASYGQGEMWYLRGSDELGGPGFVSIPGAEWAAARDIAGMKPDHLCYLLYGWLAWRLARGIKTE
jgi:hypothetical protein